MSALGRAIKGKKGNQKLFYNGVLIQGLNNCMALDQLPNFCEPHDLVSILEIIITTLKYCCEGQVG